ncbi:MAG: response regulator [Brevundimonas sp.]|uniref:response regulator n=1 Tax=Brevundimonas sp. TaxID=1871086 RepID=UPI00391DB4AD
MRGSKASRALAGLDPWLVTAAVFFVIAFAAAGYPAFRADPWSAPGLILIIAISAVALVGLFAFARAEQAPARPAQSIDLISALGEPAALVTSGGGVLSHNGAWVESGGSEALPRAVQSPGLMAAFAEARRGGQGRALLKLSGRDVEVMIARTDCGRYLVRAAPDALLEAEAPQPLSGSAPSPATLTGTDAAVRVSGAPFGSALIEGEDIFAVRPLDANAALSELTGPAPSGDAPFGALFKDESVRDARERLKDGSTGPIELVPRAFKDRTLHLYIAPEGEARRIWLFDVSAQKSLELELFQSQKMQAVGQLAGGVAHDFNNLLSVIEGHLDLLFQRHPVGDPSYDSLREIRSTTTRAADLIGKMLAFSRKQTVRRERLDLGELISEFQVLLRRLMREDVRLETEHGRDLPVILADRGQLETAVMNLAVNARDAMQGFVPTGQGVLTIRTARLGLDDARQLGWPGSEPSSIGMIEVADNGPGIAPELLDKIFEPFFTTKAVNKGTGMGLATVYGIVQQAGGHISVSNRSDGQSGAVFRILLPEAAPARPEESKVAAGTASAPPVRRAPRDLSGAGRILLVEDEPAVRDITARLLRQRGYEVITADDGLHALELAEVHAGEIDMMISDVIMPGLDGPALLRKARPFLGDVPVMFISGYAESYFSDLLQDDANISFLPKPLNIKLLAERVKQELHQDQAPAADPSLTEV